MVVARFRTPVATCCIFLANLCAAATLDQSVEISEPLQSAGIYPTQWAAQTFTSGVTGVLDSVDLVLYGGSVQSRLIIEFRTFQLVASPASQCPFRCLVPDFSSNGLLGRMLVAGSALPSIDLTNLWSNVSLASANIQLVQGTQYAMILSTDTDSNINWRNNNDPNGVLGDRYLPGQGYVSNGANPAQASWNSLGKADYNFRTYVSAVPESSALWLFMVGVSLILGLQPRRKSAADSHQIF